MYVCERLECGVANHSKVRATHYFAVFELNMAATLHKLYREEYYLPGIATPFSTPYHLTLTMQFCLQCTEYVITVTVEFLRA